MTSKQLKGLEKKLAKVYSLLQDIEDEITDARIDAEEKGATHDS